MARDYHQARYVLKQGNVTTFSVKDFNSEYNLVGFYNNRSVFEYTDEKLNSEPKQQIEDDISKKEASESSIFSKQIIIKPISSSGRVVLINDKNVKVSVKKCIDVPKNILKMLGEKQHVQAANIDSTNKIDGEHNLSTKFIRTYQKSKDKTYQSTNIDKDKHENVNIDLIEASTIKDCEGTCVSEAETAGIRTVDITKLSEEGLINKSSYKIPLDQIKELLKGAASKNLIFLKHPIERRKTIDSAELQVLKADIVPTVDIEKVEDNLRPVYFKGYVRKKPTVDTGETTPKETFSVINLSANISNTTTNVGDDGKRDGELSTTSTNSVGNQMCREDGGGIKLKIKRVVNKQETNHTVTDMGKIKHFKEKSSNADKCSTTLIAEEAVFEMSPTPIHAKFNSDSRDNLINTFEKFKEVVTPGYENWTILPDNFIRIEPHAGTTFTPIVDTNKRRQKNKAARAHTLQRQLIKQETQKYIKALVNRNKKKKLRSRSPKLVANSCQTETVKLNDNSTQTDSFQPEQEAPLPTTYNAIHLEDYEQCQIVVSDVNFGNGPQIPTCGKSGARAVYNLGNNLDNFVGDVNIAPSELVDMGYLNGENVHSAMISAKLQEKQTFQEYLKICRVPDSAGNLPLHLEVMSNNLNEVRRQALMLNLWKVSIDTPNASNLTPLHLAVIHDSDESIVSFLLERGADLSCTDAEGNNAMHLAVFHNSLKLLRLLLQRANDTDFNLNDFNYEGFSPLLLATIEDKLEMVKTFLEFDANPNVKDQKSGRTPLFHAVENNNLKMVKLLLHSDADKKIKNFSGTSTHDAVFELEKISPEIKNLIIGKELFTVNNTTVDKRKKPTDKRKEPAEKTKEVCTKKLKTVKTFRKIKM